MVLLETASRDRHRTSSPRCVAHIWPASGDRLTRALVLGTALWCAVLAGAHAAEQGTSSRRAAYSGRVQTEAVPSAAPEAALAAPRVMRVSTATQVEPPSDPNEPLFRETAAADAAAAGPETASTRTGKTSRPAQMAPAGVANKAVGRTADGASARSKARTSATSDRIGARHGKADQAGKAVKRTAAVDRASRPRREAERVALQRGAVRKPAAGHIEPRTGRSLAGRSQAVRRPQAHTRQAKAQAVTTPRQAARPARSAQSATTPTARQRRQLAQTAGAKASARDAHARHQTTQAGKASRNAARPADAAPVGRASHQLRQATAAGSARPAATQPSGKPARQATRRAAVRPGSHHASARHSRPVPADAQRQAKPRG